MGKSEPFRNNNYSVAMKKYLYISLCASLFLCSCEKSPVADDSGNAGTEIVLPSGEYIQFNTEALTRGTLINGGTLQENFDVLGYKFASSWEAFKAQAKPNVFGRTVGSTTYDHVETIEYDAAGGYHSYPDPVEWTGNNYAFFAYYPCAADRITVSEGNFEGTPYIDYTLNIADVANHKDVMTACVKGTHKQASKHGVNLSMQHRLVALDFIGYSYVDAKAVNALNQGHEGWTDIDEGTPVEIVIDKLDITLSGIAYDKVRLSLDKEEDIDNATDGIQSMVPGVIEGHQTTRTFTYVQDEDPLSFRDGVTTFLSSNLNGDTANGCPMILIPQDTELTCTVDITYRIKAGDVISNVPFSPKPEETTVTIKRLDEGVYNYILFAFTKTGLYLKAEQGAQWNDITVKHEFE